MLAYTTRSWVDIMEEQASARTTQYLRLSAAEWKDECRRLVIGWQGDLRDFITFANRVDAARAAAEKPVVAPAPAQAPKTEFEVDFALWKEMIENPAQYGKDLEETWLALDDKLSAGPGRWRLGAFWVKRAEEEEALEQARIRNAADVKERQAAIVIQAAVRGHIARNAQPYRDCCMCLAHVTCPFLTDVGLICRECQEQGPYSEITGPLADPWSEFRGDTQVYLPPRVIRSRIRAA